MPKSKSSIPSIFGACLLPAVALCILAIIVLVVFAGSIPAQAKDAFGAPASRLGNFQTFSLSLQLLLQKGSLTHGRDPHAAPRLFHIRPGESTASISSRLQSEGFIARADCRSLKMPHLAMCPSAFWPAGA